MRILTRMTGYYITINSLRPSRIVKSSDDEDTDVRWLDIIPQLYNNQLDEGLGMYEDE
jgi:hypothetical protein